MNKKLLMYKHTNFDYVKMNKNKTFRKAMINRLKFWYYKNRFGDYFAFYFLYKKQRNQIHQYFKFFDNEVFEFKNSKEVTDYFYKKLNKKICPNCNKTFYSKDGICCSITCSNQHKAKDEKYLKKLSESIKQSHKNMSDSDKQAKSKKISESLKLYSKENPKELESTEANYCIQNPDIITECECSNKLKFKNFSEGYYKTCGSIECITSMRLKSTKENVIHVDNLDKEFILENMYLNGRFNKDLCNKYDCSDKEAFDIMNNIVSTPLCEECSKPVEFGDFKYGYKKFCSVDCKHKNQAIRKKQELRQNEINREDWINKFVIDDIFDLDSCKKYHNIRTGDVNNYKREFNISAVNAWIHFTNILDINEEYWRKEFIKDNKFDIDACSLHHNVGHTYILNKKIKFNIKNSNITKRKFYTENEISSLIEDSLIRYRYNFKEKSNVELDVYSEQYKFAVEYDGMMWHSYGDYVKNDGTISESISNSHIENRNRHLEKTELCESEGIQLFRIWENEWEKDPVKKKIWISMLESKQGNSTRIYARKCIIKEVSSSESRDFLNNNHLQGFCKSAYKYGLYYNDELVQLLTIRKPINKENYEYELARLCAKINYVIVGGASKLLKHFERTIKPKSLLSYANRRWSTGNVYEQLNFEFIKDTKPNYFYIHIDDDYSTLHSRQKFMKHKLKDLFDNFDENQSEFRNMVNNGYRRIWDCGNKVYVKRY